MKTLLLAPHADDESLFAAYVCQRDRPHILCCFDQGRDLEFTYACAALGCSSATFQADDAVLLRMSLKLYQEAEVVWAPAFEENGHRDHNFVARAAEAVFGERVRSYLTYAPRGHRSTWGTEVEPEPWMVAQKLRALGCYESQIADPSTRPWFYDLLDMREWVEA